MELKLAQWSFLGLIVSLPLVRPFNADFQGIQIPLTDVVFALSFGFWSVALLRGITTLHHSQLYIFLALYAATLTASTIFSSNFDRSAIKLLGGFYLIALCILTFNLASDERFFRKIVFAWMIATALLVLTFLFGFVLFYLGYKTRATNYFLSQYGSMPAWNYPRIRGLFENANMAANFLNVSVLLTLYYALSQRKRFVFVLLVGALAASIFTFSPGIGGIVLALGLFFRATFLRAGKTVSARLLIISAVLVSVIFLGASALSPDTDNTDQQLTLGGTTVEVSVRVLTWQSALETFKGNPILGLGTGLEAANVRYTTVSGQDQFLSDAHNTFFNILALNGLLGLAAFAGLIFFTMRRVCFSLAKTDSRSQAVLALSCAFVGAVLYQGVTGSFEDARHLWIAMGMLAAITEPSTNDAFDI